MTSQSLRIQGAQEIVLDETAGVADLTCPRAQPVLERRERTDPAAVFDKYAPNGGGDVRPRESRPTQDQQSTEYDEENEREVDTKDDARKEAEHTQYLLRGADRGESHLLQQRAEPGLTLQRIDHRMDGQIGGPAASLIEGSLAPVDSVLGVA